MMHVLRSSGSSGESYDVAVVIPTIMRAELERAAKSVFSQQFSGRVQVLIGVDVPGVSPGLAHCIDAACPEHMSVTWFDPEYSTSQAHGGVHANAFGGSIRTVLSHLARANLIAYLDDDNWWAPHHLSDLCRAIAGHAWAFSLRWFVHPESAQAIVLDDFESVGPNRGIYARRAAGFVDTSSLMLDRRTCEPMFHEWSIPAFADGTGEDRRVLNALSRIGPPGETNRPSVYYKLNPHAGAHPHRMDAFVERGSPLPETGLLRASSRIGTARMVEDYLAVRDEPRLRIGWNLTPRDGWLNGDMAPVAAGTFPLLRSGHLPFANATFAEIEITALDRMRFPQAHTLLVETARVLRHGGRLRIRCLDLYRVLTLFLNDTISDDARTYLTWARETLVPEIRGATPTIVLNALYRRQGLRFLFGEALLRGLLAQAGFTDITRTAPASGTPSAYSILALEAQRQ